MVDIADLIESHRDLVMSRPSLFSRWFRTWRYKEWCQEMREHCWRLSQHLEWVELSSLERDTIKNMLNDGESYL